jgi:hypothetical protein
LCFIFFNVGTEYKPLLSCLLVGRSVYQLTFALLFFYLPSVSALKAGLFRTYEVVFDAGGEQFS